MGTCLDELCRKEHNISCCVLECSYIKCQQNCRELWPLVSEILCQLFLYWVLSTSVGNRNTGLQVENFYICFGCCSLCCTQYNAMQCSAMLCNATQFIHISKLHSKACTGYYFDFFQPKNDLLLRFSGGPAVICIMGLKLLRSSFSDPSRQHIVLLWTVLFFHFDYSHSSETFVVDYFFMSIFISKVSGKQRLVALVPQSFYACHLSQQSIVRFLNEDAYEYWIFSILSSAPSREPASFWREIVIPGVILLRVLARIS